MTDTTDKEWATKYLLDPLTAPEPSDETGPGTHFTRELSSNNRRKEKQASVSSYPTPPSSASPSRSTFSSNNPYASASAKPQYSPVNSRYPPSTNPYSSSRRQQASGSSREKSRRSRAGSLGPQSAVGGSGSGSGSGSLSRSVSLNERPLDAIKKETKAANRSPHLRKKHVPSADTIDVLDRSFGFAYHHEGPYDATLLSRNLNPKSSPLEAVKRSHEEALRATPREYLKDALDRHVPLQGVASIPPGQPDLSGKEMNYEEGADLMREPDAGGGAYKRWADMKYHPDDLKGKGEPSYTIEKALKKHDDGYHKRIVSDGDSAYEMQSRRPVTSSSRRGATPPRRLTRLRSQSDNDAERAMSMDSRLKGMNSRTSAIASGSGRGRGENVSDNTGTKLGQGLKKRFGSLRIGRSSGGRTTDN